MKNHKNIGFPRNTGPDPLKNHSYQASIQYWAIIGRPAKRHLIEFRWWADDGPLIVVYVLGSSLPINYKKKIGPALTNLLDPRMLRLFELLLLNQIALKQFRLLFIWCDIENTRFVSFDIKLNRQGFENAC